MKKFIFASLLAMTISAPALAEPFSGTFVGAEVGYDNFEVKGTNIAGSGLSVDGLSGNGVVGGVFTGFDFPINDTFFVGAEASLNLSGGKISASFGSDTIVVKAHESYIFSGRLGAKVNASTGIYARLGWAHTRFKATAPGYAESSTEDGFQYGGGVETYVSDNVSIRAEYTAIDYKSAGLGNGIKVGNNQARAGIAYRF